MNKFYLLFSTSITALGKAVFVGLFCLLFSYKSDAQMAVTPAQSAAVLAQTIAGPGVIIINPTLTCPSNAEGIFNITGVGGGFNLNQGIVLTTGNAATAPGTVGVNITNGLSAGDPSNYANTDNGAPGDAQLTALVGGIGPSTHDACSLEFDFKAAGDSVKVNYIFGSEEYTIFTCSPYNDVFGFFLSGPGFPAGGTNIAIVPGTTNIPVAINTVNCGPTGGFDSSACYTIIGMPPNPYVAYYCSDYVNNIAGLVASYDGITTELTARAGGLNPCDTYHMKMAIADADDDFKDSGVFLEQASFSSQAVVINAVGTAPTGAATLPYIVRGCPGGAFAITMPTVQPAGDSLTLHYILGGDAVNGTDYAQIADSSYVLPGQFTDTILINPLAVTPPAGPKTVKLYLYSSYLCNGAYSIIDSSSIVIYDSLSVGLLTPDTTVCIGQSVNIIGTNYGIADTFLRYAWVPSGSLNDTTLLSPTATPTVTTTYTLTTSIPGSTCPASHNQIKIGIIHPPVIAVTFHYNSICLGTPIQLGVSTSSPDTPYHYMWVDGSTLNNDTVSHPYATPPIGDINYTVTVSPNVPNCSSTDTVHLHVLPNDFTLFVHDSSLCKGVAFQVYAYGDTEFQYSWSPQTGVSNPGTLDPVITADTTTTYLVTATYPGCTNMVHQITLDVQPNPIVYIGGDRSLCKGDTVHIDASVLPDNYHNYQYDWIPDSNLVHAGQPNVIYYGDTSAVIRLIVTTQAGCTGTDSSFITVHDGPHASLSPIDTAICPNDSIRYNVTFLDDNTTATYHWIPDYAFDSTVSTPVAHPVTSSDYGLIVTNEWGCKDTLTTHVTVRPAAVVGLPDSVTLYPGESYQMNPLTNCTSFRWFPPYGLTDTTITNPVASPEANTKYYIYATTEYGCSASDSISVYVDASTLLAMPNAFVPGSGENNEFKIITKGIAKLNYFRIFNRWGEMMFETDDINKGWDGMYKGKPQPMGVYVYEIDASSSTTGKLTRFTKQGNVTLIR